jgi:hypothetical protein
MGYKSRGGWSIPVCLRGECLYHGDDSFCLDCYGFSKFVLNSSKKSDIEETQSSTKVVKKSGLVK